MGSLDLDDLEKSDLGQMGLLPWGSEEGGVREEEETENKEKQQEPDSDDDEESDSEDEALTSALDDRLVEARVTGFAKQKTSRGSDFAYVVEVVWGDGRCSIVKRTFNDFCNFHYNLLEEFMNVSGKANPVKLTFMLPSRADGADDNIAVAESRELQLNKYVQELIRLPAKVSASSMVLSFFESRGSDPQPYNDDDLSDFQFSDQYMLCWL